LVLIEAARLDWCISSTSSVSSVSDALDSTTVAGIVGGGVSSNLTFEALVLLLPSSNIGRGPGREVEGPGSDSKPSRTPGRCLISSDVGPCGDLANLRSVDVLSVRSDGAREGAAEAIGDRIGAWDGLVVPLPLSRSDDLLDEPFDRVGRASGVYAGDGPLSAMDNASRPGGGASPGLSPL
jgi:hypothetical protein